MMTKDFFVVYAYKLLQVVIIILNDIIILQIVNLIFVREFLKIETMCKNTKTKKKNSFIKFLIPKMTFSGASLQIYHLI